MEIRKNISIREPARFVIPAILIPCGMPSLLRKYREVHKSVSRTIVRHRVAHYALLASPPRTRSPDYPIGTGFPFVDRHSSVFSRRIPLHLPLVLASKRPSVLVARSSGNEGTRGEAGGEDGRFTRGQRRPSGGVKR